MKQFLDFLPLILFFIVYKISPQSHTLLSYTFEVGGIYSATLILIFSTIIIYGVQYLIYKQLDKNQIITLVAVILFGGLTLSFRTDVFIKWKAPVINWIFGVAFLVSPLFSAQPLIQKIMGHVIHLPPKKWKQLNISWALFFIMLGTANLYVAFNFEKYWVDFKIFGSLGLTILFMVGQCIILAKHFKSIEKKSL